MANGTDSEDFVLCSQVRAGLKREFAFALKVQSEIAGSLGRTRARSAPNGGRGHVSSGNSSNKRLKSSGSKKVMNGGSKDGEAQRMVEEQTVSDAEKLTATSSGLPESVGALMIDEVPKSDAEMKGNKASIIEDELDCISEEEPKSDVVDMTSDDEPKSGRVELMSKDETRDDLARPMHEKEFCGDMVELMGADEPKGQIVEWAKSERPKDNAETHMCLEEPKDECVNKSRSEKVLINERMDNDEGKISNSEGIGARVPILVDDNGKVESGLLEKPLRRFTRSTLKPKVKLELIRVGNDQEDVKDKGIEKVHEGKANCVSSPLVFPLPKKYAKLSSSAEPRKFPSKLRELLGTGILEGLSVKYIRGSRVRGPSETGLRGVIKGSGILCSCDMCGEREVVTPNQFELHAGSSNKRPPEYIYLENGNTLRDVLNVCKDAPLDALETRVRNAISGSSMLKSCVCLNCRGPIPEAMSGSTKLLCASCLGLKESQMEPAQTADTTFKLPEADLSPKSSDISKNCSSRSKSQGRLTRKDLRLHKLVFEEDILPDGTEVAYYARGQKLLVGYKKGFGIFCTCCDSEVSPSQFEAHAGWASRRKPYLHIYTSNGVSLHELSVSLSKGRRFSTNENDDLCSICADGGNLLCCDGCPRAFHKECVSLSNVPRDAKWYCKYCETMFQKEKFVERNANAVAAGRVAGVDPIEQITKRCIRIVKTPAAEYGGCAICRGHDFSKYGFGPRTVILCDQCEKEFHVDCLRDNNMDDLKELPEGQWFCCMECNRIYLALHKLVAHGEEKLSDSLLDVIKKKHEEKSKNIVGLDIKWRLLRGKLVSDETRALLSKAVAIFHEQFDPILEAGTHRDFIPNMVYGRHMREQEFGNMYCAVLTVNSSVVSAGIFRVFGQKTAELPLVATISDCQGLGYFQCLFSCIEGLLESLNVRNLVLPAAEEAESIWTKKFGFDKITQDELIAYRKDHQMMMTFQGTSMLHKMVPNCQATVKSEDGGLT